MKKIKINKYIFSKFEAQENTPLMPGCKYAMSTPRISVTQIIFTHTRASTLKTLARGFYRKSKATFWALKEP